MSPSLDKTLIIRFSSIGDIVLSSLLVRVLRKRFPHSRLDFIVKEEFADLVRHNPNITDVITFPTNGTFPDLIDLRSRIRQAGYDLIIDIHDSLRSRFISFGAKRVVRINKRKLARFLLVHRKRNLYERLGGGPSVALRYLEPVHEFGIEDDEKGLEIFFADADQQKIANVVRGSGFGDQFIGICPSAKHKTKMWLKERFAEAAAVLGKQLRQPIALFGSESERRRCDEIVNLIQLQNPESRILNLAGQISLAETAAMMDKCSILISNDSGLMHIGAARKRPVVAIFGSTVQELGFFPLGTNSVVIENKHLTCRPCTHIGLPECPKGHFKCMNEITAAQVIASAHELLAKSWQ